MDEYFPPPAMEANLPDQPTYHPRNRTSSSISRSAMPPAPCQCASRNKIILREERLSLCWEISSATSHHFRSPAILCARPTGVLDVFGAIPYKIGARYDAVLSPSDHGSA